MKTALIAASLAALAMSTVNAQTTPTVVTTKALVSACQNSASTADQAFCHGFAQGVFDTYSMSRHPSRNPEFICFKDQSPSRKQTMTDFLAWTEKHPQYADRSAADTLLRYLASAFPCKS